MELFQGRAHHGRSQSPAYGRREADSFVRQRSVAWLCAAGAPPSPDHPSRLSAATTTGRLPSEFAASASILRAQGDVQVEILSREFSFPGRA